MLRMRLQIPRNPRAERPDASGNTAIGKDSSAKRVCSTRLLTAGMVIDRSESGRPLCVGRTVRRLPNMSGFNPDKRAQQVVLTIAMFDGLDGVVFPLRVCLVATTKT